MTIRETAPVTLHHVQVSCPAGGEDAARRFYQGALGIPQVQKPPMLAARGGCWFRGESVEIHVGVESSFVPAKKAHPAFPGYRRFHTADGNGDRVEILAVLDAD